MANILSLQILNDERENQKLLSKLPDWLVICLGRVVHTWCEENRRFPPFKEFVAFISKEARIACDPVTALYAFKPDKTENAKGKKMGLKKFNSFSTLIKN